ncbi:MAG: ABC transporter substrate-binding protein [Egibacteraceae bacterium]
MQANVRRLAVLVLLAVVGVGCGGAPPTAGEGESPQNNQAGGAEDPFAAVLAELEGLEGEERTERLVELAQEEGGLNVYTSNTDLAEFSEAFVDAYDLEDVSVYRAQSNQVLQRLLQESQAGFQGADLVDTNAEELATLNGEGLLREYDGPAREGLVDASLQEGWTGSRLNIFTVSWNSDLVDRPPTSYQDLADARFKGLMMMEPRAYEWYMTIAGHLTEEEGMSQEEVDEMFSGMAANSVLVEGNTEHAQFLASGEHGVSTSVYNHLVDELAEDGAPVTREPPVEPVVVRPNGIGLLKSAQNPASALLFFEWLLTDGQELLRDEFRIPARVELQQGELDGLETVDVDVEQLINEGTEWEERYNELLRNAQAAGS